MICYNDEDAFLGSSGMNFIVHMCWRLAYIVIAFPLIYSLVLIIRNLTAKAIYVWMPYRQFSNAHTPIIPTGN